MRKVQKIDVVFVVGPMGRTVDKQISRIARQLTRSANDCRVASIHFNNDYHSTLQRDLFYSRVFDFSDVYFDMKSTNRTIQGNPLQHVTNLSFREDATRFCFLISNVLPFNDSCEETVVYDNEIGEYNNANDNWGNDTNTPVGADTTTTIPSNATNTTNTAQSVPTEKISETDTTNIPDNGAVTDSTVGTENTVNVTTATTDSTVGTDSTTENTVNATTATTDNVSSAVDNDGTALHAGNSTSTADDELNTTNNANKPEPEKAPTAADTPSSTSHTANSSASTSTETTSKSNEVYHEDPLRTCRRLAAMGIVLYCIETYPYSTIYKDMYVALAYITGGQYINVNTTHLAKTIKCAILEEVSLERLVGYVRDYLCVAWLAWGRMKARKPSCIEDLSDNVLNHLCNVNITTLELLVGSKPLDPPNKHARKIVGLKDISEARSIRISEDNWAAEMSWLADEVCDEVIPGYVATPSTNESQKELNKVTISQHRRMSRNQARRIVVRTLARRPGMIRKQQQEQTDQKTNTHATRQSFESPTHCDRNNKETPQIKAWDVKNEKERVNEIPSQEQLSLSCKQEVVIIKKLQDNCFGDRNCVLV